MVKEFNLNNANLLSLPDYVSTLVEDMPIDDSVEISLCKVSSLDKKYEVLKSKMNKSFLIDVKKKVQAEIRVPDFIPKDTLVFFYMNKSHMPELESGELSYLSYFTNKITLILPYCSFEVLSDFGNISVYYLCLDFPFYKHYKDFFNIYVNSLLYDSRYFYLYMSYERVISTGFKMLPKFISFKRNQLVQKYICLVLKDESITNSNTIMCLNLPDIDNKIQLTVNKKEFEDLIFKGGGVYLQSILLLRSYIPQSVPVFTLDQASEVYMEFIRLYQKRVANIKEVTEKTASCLREMFNTCLSLFLLSVKVDEQAYEEALGICSRDQKERLISQDYLDKLDAISSFYNGLSDIKR